MTCVRKAEMIWPILLASAVALTAFGGCSAIYRETRYVYHPPAQREWRQVDTLGEYGQFTLECGKGGVTIQTAGQLYRAYYVEKIGPPLVPMAKTKRVEVDSTSKLFVRLSISSPHDSCVIDLLRISLHVANDSVVHPTNFLAREFVVHDTTRVLGLEFWGALLTVDTVKLDFGAFRVGSVDVEWPPLTYVRTSDTHYSPVGFPTE